MHPWCIPLWLRCVVVVVSHEGRDSSSSNLQVKGIMKLMAGLGRAILGKETSRTPAIVGLNND